MTLASADPRPMFMIGDPTMSLPTPVQELWNVWREMEGSISRTVTVNLYGADHDLRDGVRALLIEKSNRPEALRMLELAADAPPEADVHLVLVDPSFGPTTTQTAILRRVNPQNLILILIGGNESQFEGRRREVATSVGVKQEQVLTVATMSELRTPLTRRLLSQFSDWMVPLARQFPILREEAANQEMQGTAQQNAMVGAIPVPGADMPLMTANQVKMVLRLAAIYDQPRTVDRAKEVMAVVGGGLALRTAARQVAKFVPGPGWLLGGALGYGGTFAMGKAAIEYFKRTTDAPAAASVTPRRDPAKAVIDTDATVVED
jgi:uncharacterized protein (DUF697 family)